MNKEQQLTFNLGITNVPSDTICDDNALEESLGMVYSEGEHKPIQQPKKIIELSDEDLGDTLMYIHHLVYKDLYIFYHAVLGGNGKLYWRTEDNSERKTIIEVESGNEVLQISSIGKTLVVNATNGLSKYIWRSDDNDYFALSNITPPVLDFYCMRGGSYHTTVLVDEIIKFYDNVHYIQKIGEWNDAVKGCYGNITSRIKKDNNFYRPFFLRYAVKLYDGTYTCISQPILFMTAWKNQHTVISAGDGDYLSIGMRGFYLGLIGGSHFDYSELEDIVDEVVVFVSDGINIYDMTVDQVLNVEDGDVGYKTYTEFEGMNLGNYNKDTFTESGASYGAYVFAERTQTAVMDDIRRAGTGVFYKLCSLGKTRSEINGSNLVIEEHVVENLLEQETLPDDYFGHCPISAKTSFVYNSRIILGNVQRGVFEGFDKFMDYNYTSTRYTWRVYVYVETSSGMSVVYREFKTREVIGTYFFYPDHRAKKAMFFYKHGDSWLFYKEVELHKHEKLNGAYYLVSAYPTTPEVPTPADPQKPQPATVMEYESLPNQIYVSEVNNPLVFKAEGNVTVGNGDIMAVSSMTQALSQGQFGQYPLVIFATDGIWAANTGATGLFTSLTPMSREVCNNVKSITQTDGPIFFSSEKGLMVIDGPNVRCVSEQLNGKTLASQLSLYDFLKEAKIAYDYRDSLLWIGRDDSDTLWIYAIKAGTFHHYELSAEDSEARSASRVIIFDDEESDTGHRSQAISDTINGVSFVNSYPDYLVQIGPTIYSLLQRENINNDTKDYSGKLVTRPIKFENGLALKSIMQLRHVKQMAGLLSMTIKGSNDLQNWRQITSLKGTPWRYYQFTLNFTNMKATDRYSGMVLEVQERRTNRLR